MGVVVIPSVISVPSAPSDEALYHLNESVPPLMHVAVYVTEYDTPAFVVSPVFVLIFGASTLTVIGKSAVHTVVPDVNVTVTLSVNDVSVDPSAGLQVSLSFSDDVSRTHFQPLLNDAVISMPV